MYSESEGGAQYEAEASCHMGESEEAKYIKLHMFADVVLLNIAKSPSGVNLAVTYMARASCMLRGSKT
jgi:hypothetical protein